MGRNATRNRRVRNKLQWFFENTAAADLHSMPIQFEIRTTDGNRRQWASLERKSEMEKSRRVLLGLCRPEGIAVTGCRLQLTGRMFSHVVAEFTAKDNALHLLYGGRKVSEASKGAQYRATLNAALTRIEAALYQIGVLGTQNRRIGLADRTRRNALGYLVKDEKGGRGA